MRRKLIVLLLATAFTTLTWAKQSTTILLTILVANPHYMDLTWTQSPTPGGTYTIFRGPSPGAEGTMALANNIVGFEYFDMNVVKGATYCYEVSTVDAS